MTTTNMIQTALVGVMHDISTTGIGKTQRNVQQGYTFRGIEAAMNELSPLLVKHRISVTARYSDLSVTERFKGDPKDGKAMRFCTIKGAFTFAAEDGSSVTAECFGEAMDSGDKAVVKAQSVAFRTALFQQFVVPTMAMDPESYIEAEDDAQGLAGPAPELLQAARDAAMGGTESYKAFWQKATQEDRQALAGHHAGLKDAAAKAGHGATA